MLQVAKENDADGDLMLMDMGQGLPFRPGVFDYAVSVSAIQWLCNAEKSCHDPYKRLKSFFQSLYKCLVIGARCCFQFYPDNPKQLELITNSALENGFTGGLVVDYPHSTKAKKYYLFLQAGYTKETINEVVSTIPQGLEGEGEGSDEQVSYIKKRAEIKRQKNKRNKSKPHYKSKEWVLNKKERQKNQGREVRSESKYTGRKRPGKGF